MKVTQIAWRFLGGLAAAALVASVGGGAAAQEVLEAKRITEGLLTPASRGTVVLPVEFAYASAVLGEQGRRQAAEMAEAMGAREFDGRRFRLVGHTDARGPEHYNMNLSLKRANSLREYLIDRFRVAPERLEAEGRGELDPLERGDSAAARARNRRVELQLLPRR